MGGTVGGRYALDGRLGEGGMGQVFRARHVQLGKPFALKLISPAFALDGSARARFNEEAKLASEISHPNIVSVVDYGEDEAFGAYMVMELVEGEPLVGAAGGRAMSVKRACDILGQIADALDHIHRRGIVHGDVKADNIMLTVEPDTGGSRRRRVARLLDFGLARRAGGAVDDQISGSPHYLAPERASGAPPTVAADVYALGILGYMLLTGALPYDGNVVEILMAHIHAPVPSPSARRGEPIDAALEALVLRALEKDPNKRHPSAAAFRYELNNVMDMLALGLRRRSAGSIRQELSREAVLAAAFERSRVPQALLGRDGFIAMANKAFARLLGGDSDDGVEGGNIHDSRLAQALPDLERAICTALANDRPVELRASVSRGPDAAALRLVAWLAPLPLVTTELHLLVRVEEA